MRFPSPRSTLPRLPRRRRRRCGFRRRTRRNRADREDDPRRRELGRSRVERSERRLLEDLGRRRFTVFESAATNLVGGDTKYQISAERQGNESSYIASVSANGRFVAFVSGATNLVGNDTNATTDIFVRRPWHGKTRRISVSSSGAQANGESDETGVTNDGRFVVFDSRATNLVKGDKNGKWDVFVRDRWQGKTTRVSISSTGRGGNGEA